MVGNKSFADEYNRKYAETNSSFSVINPRDQVPKMPLTSNDGKFISPRNVENLLFNRESFSGTQFVLGAALHLFDDKVAGYVNSMGRSMEDKLEVGDGGKIKMPEYQREIDYFRLEKIVQIEHTIYPKREKEPMFYQHKPYNYYTTILRMYFPEEYDKLEKKYLVENL